MGVANTTSPATVATMLPFVNVTSTDDAAAGVFAPITMVTEVALTYVHAASVPKLGVAPTFAVHAELMKSVPVTVMVLPTYAAVGATEVAVGLALAACTEKKSMARGRCIQLCIFMGKRARVQIPFGFARCNVRKMR